MTDEQIIAKSYFAGAEAALDGVLIDHDVTAVNSGIPGQIAPTAIRVSHRLAQFAEQRGFTLQCRKRRCSRFNTGFDFA